jgi:predicted nucleic acid-binding protein
VFLIIDTNVLFSLAKKGKVRNLLKRLWDRGVIPITPEFVIEEIFKIKREFIKRAGFTELEFKNFIEELPSVVKFIPQLEYEKFLEEAKRISPHIKDTPLFALSLAFNKAPIWSREPRLKRQKIIKVLNDREIEEMLKKL